MYSAHYFWDGKTESLIEKLHLNNYTLKSYISYNQLNVFLYDQV